MRATHIPSQAVDRFDNSSRSHFVPAGAQHLAASASSTEDIYLGPSQTQQCRGYVGACQLASKQREYTDEDLQGVYASDRGRASPMFTPLKKAVLAQDLEAIYAELKQGAAVNACDEEGTTALHIAAALKDVALVQALCAAPGIDLNAKLKTPKRDTPLDFAIYCGNKDVRAFLVGKGAKESKYLTQGQSASLAGLASFWKLCNRQQRTASSA